MRKVIRILKTPVTLLILLAILGYGAMWGYKQVTLDTAPAQAACVMQDVGKTLTSDKVSMRVLNGGEKPRAAKDTRSFFIAFDFHVIYYNNTEQVVDQVTIIGNSAEDPEVRLVAQAFKPPVRTVGDGRADHVVDVIVPTKFELNKTTPKSIPVDGPVCLPPITSAGDTASPSTTASPTPSPSTTTKKKK